MYDLYGYHVVLTTHNSRISQRMIRFKVHRGPAIKLNLDEEIVLTKIMGQVIVDSGYRCVAFNICSDHVHLLIVCKEGKLSGQIQKLKSISSKLFHRSGKITSHDPSEHKNHLWSQKFYRGTTNEWELSILSNQPGMIYRTSHLSNSIRYIEKNRVKHGLTESNELEEIIGSFVMSVEDAFDQP